MIDVIVALKTGGNSENDAEPRPRALHMTQSIFLRNLAPTITHQEVEAVITDRHIFVHVIGRLFVKWFALCYRTVVLSCLSVLFCL